MRSYQRVSYYCVVEILREKNGKNAVPLAWKRDFALAITLIIFVKRSR